MEKEIMLSVLLRAGVYHAEFFILVRQMPSAVDDDSSAIETEIRAIVDTCLYISSAAVAEAVASVNQVVEMHAAAPHTLHEAMVRVQLFLNARANPTKSVGLDAKAVSPSSGVALVPEHAADSPDPAPILLPSPDPAPAPLPSPDPVLYRVPTPVALPPVSALLTLITPDIYQDTDLTSTAAGDIELCCIQDYIGNGKLSVVRVRDWPITLKESRLSALPCCDPTRISWSLSSTSTVSTGSAH